MRYLLDSNAVIALLKSAQTPIGHRIRQTNPDDVGISSIVAHELYFGAFKSRRVEHNIALVDSLRFPLIPFDEDDAKHAGEIRALLAALGRPIGPLDVLIAGQARAKNLILVTHNTREFERVPSLRIDDWLI